MDEPFGALDTHTKIDMHEVLLRIWEREQQTVLFVTHDLGEALTLADRIILFSARPGRIKDMFEVDFAAAAGCREGAGDAALRRTVPAHLALARRGIRQGARAMRMRRNSLSTLLWQVSICVVVLSIWQWGYRLHARFPWLVPDLLDPYFISKPSEIFEQFPDPELPQVQARRFQRLVQRRFCQMHGAH